MSCRESDRGAGDPRGLVPATLPVTGSGDASQDIPEEMDVDEDLSRARRLLPGDDLRHITWGGWQMLYAVEVLFHVFNVRYTARGYTLVVSNLRPEEVLEPRLRPRFLDVAVCQVVPNSGEDYRQCGERIKALRE
jgi:hypothetical protein